MKRKDFVTKTIISTGAITLAPGLLTASSPERISLRPPVKKRLFISQAVEDEILRIKRDITDPEIFWLFENCYPNTLDTTVHFSEQQGEPDLLSLQAISMRCGCAIQQRRCGLIFTWST